MKIDPELFNIVCPIVKVERHKRGYILYRQSKIKYRPDHPPERGEVVKRTNRSLSRLAYLAANTDTVFKSLMTLTWPRVFPYSGARVKGIFQEFLQRSRRRFGEYSYLWFLEFQKRDAPHFHILTTIENPKDYHRKDFARMWAELVLPEDLYVGDVESKKMFHVKQSDVIHVHSQKAAWDAIRKVDGAMRYVLKYAFKKEQVEVPDNFLSVGRFWAHNADVSVRQGAIFDVDGDEFQDILRLRGNPCAKFPVMPKHVIIRDTDT